MAKETEQPARVCQLVQATPVTVAGRVIQPVVRLEGWWQEWPGRGAGALVRLAPATINVQDGERTYAVPIVEPTKDTLRTFFYIGSAVSLLCMLVMLLTAWAARRR